MAGVREDLILDITQASRSIDALEAQVTAAFAGVNIEIDTTGISSEISRAVSNADTNATVTVDTTGVSSEITRAVDVADTDVNIGADTTVARAQVNALNQDLSRTTASAGALGVALSGAALLLGVRGLFSLAEASSAVNEQITGSEIVFGDLAISVQQFADQADRIGLAEAQALQLSNTFGQLALSAGLSDEAVATFATTIVERGTDIASLRDIDITQTLDALRSGLVGETEPLRNIGIFMNEALVSAEAYRLGIAEVGTELTDAQKIQARYNIILQQSEIAAGNFALTQEGLANTQRQVKAELQDLAAEAGATLEPTFLNLAEAARDRLLPALGELAQETLPALGSILEDLAPVLGITLDLLIAGAPLLQLTADVIGAIPAPLLAAAGAWLAFNRAQRIATTLGATERISKLGTAVGGLGTKFAGLGAGTQLALGSAAVLTGFVALSLEGEDVISGLAGSVFELGDALTGASSGRAAKLSKELEGLLAGLNTNDLGEAQLAVGRLRAELVEIGSIEDPTISFGDKGLFASTGARNATERANAIGEQISNLNLQARAEVLAGIETGRFTQAQIDATRAQTNREKPQSAIIRQLELLRLEEDLAARNAKPIIDKYEDIAAAYTQTGDALERLGTEAPRVGLLIAGIRQSGGSSEFAFLDLAAAIDGANLSTEGFADAAALLGLSTDELKGFVDGLSGSLTEFVDAAVAGLPTVTDVLGQVQEDVQGAEDEMAASQDRAARTIEASVSQLAAGLREQAGEIADFRDDLERITDAGFSDIAGLLAQQGLEAGEGYADELAAAIDAGNTQILDDLRAANDEFETESMSTVDFIRNELGPEFLSATGIIAAAITDTFTSGLNFDESIRIASGLAQAELDPQAEQIAAVTAVKGADAGRAFGAALKFDKAVIDAGVAAGLALQSDEFKASLDPAEAAGVATGNVFIDGFLFSLAAGTAKVKPSAEELGLTLEDTMKKVLGIESPSRVAMDIGRLFTEGLALGVTGSAGLAVSAGTIAGRSAADGLASQVPAFGVRAGTGSAAGGGGRLHPDDIAAIGRAAGGNGGPSITVNNPVPSSSESSIIRELKSIRLRSGT